MQPHKKNSETSKNTFYEQYFDADDYDVMRNDVGSFCTRSFILKHLTHTTGRILEVGTGISSILQDLPNFERYGIDISEATIKKVDHHFKNQKIPATFIVADAQSIPLPAAFFDVIVSAHTLEHIQNDAAALKECARLLKPGGECIFFVPGRIDGTATEEEWLNQGHYRSYNLQRFKDLEAATAGDLTLTLVRYPHKIHNLIWNRLKNGFRWANYPLKKWIFRDNKTYEARPWYKQIILPAVATTLDALDSLTYATQDNFLDAEANVMVKFLKN